MKKNTRTLLILTVLIGLAILAYFLTKQEGNSKLASEALSDFAIDDTASIDKLVLTDTYGGDGVVVIRTEEGWKGENLECIQEHLITSILTTIKHIKVKGPVPKASVNNLNKNIAAHHKKMEIYQNGKLTKTWYIGNPTPDHYGTYMLLKDEVKGKSPEPFIMFLPSMHGNLRSRFVTDSRELVCSGIFNYNPANIGQVDVNYLDSTEYSFTIKALGTNKFQLLNGTVNISNFDTTLVRDYLLGYRKVHFENPNYLLDDRQIDSLRRSQPTTTIAVTLKSGESKEIKCYRKWLEYEKFDLNGKRMKWDRDRLWIQLPDGRIVVAQYFVFDKLLRKLPHFTHSTN